MNNSIAPGTIGSSGHRFIGRETFTVVSIGYSTLTAQFGELRQGSIQRAYLMQDTIENLVLRDFQVVSGLEIEPEA